MINASEKEILLITQEECAEVTQAISKVFRFGIDAKHNGKSNRDRFILDECVHGKFVRGRFIIGRKLDSGEGGGPN